MTEKRFTLELYEGTKQIKAFKDNGEIIYPLNLVELLNELHEENHSLKFQLDECRNNKLFSRRQLEKENEQLKEQWKEKRHEDINELSFIAMRYKALEKENEQLKGEVAHYKLILMSLEQEAKRISSIRRSKND